MKPRVLLVLAGAGMGILGLSCSAPTGETIVITALFPPSTGAATSGCNASATQIGTGVLDTELVAANKLGYLLFPQVVNKQVSSLMATTTGMTGGTEQNQVTVDEADIDITFDPAIPDLSTNSSLTHLKQVTYAYIPPAGGTATIPVEAIPAATAAMIPNDGMPRNAYVTLRLVGETHNDTVKTNEVTFGIRICKGCLVNMLGPCCTAAVNVGVCNPVQDATVDCCADSTGAPVCPAKVLTGAVCSDGGAP